MGAYDETEDAPKVHITDSIIKLEIESFSSSLTRLQRFIDFYLIMEQEQRGSGRTYTLKHGVINNTNGVNVMVNQRRDYSMYRDCRHANFIYYHDFGNTMMPNRMIGGNLKRCPIVFDNETIHNILMDMRNSICYLRCKNDDLQKRYLTELQDKVQEVICLQETIRKLKNLIADQRKCIESLTKDIEEHVEEKLQMTRKIEYLANKIKNE